MCFAFFLLIFSLFSQYFLSKVNFDISPATERVILLTVLLTRPTVFPTSPIVPLISPLPPSSGPYIKPSLGFSKNSITPSPISLNKRFGFPNISTLPIIVKNYFLTSYEY